ncbi:pre-mRNA-splicing regulator WTAP-like [Glandiceps talaboti]
MSESEPPLKRVRLSQDDMKQMSKEEILARWSKQDVYIDTLESKAANDSLGTNEELAGLRETEEKLKYSTRKENVLVMRLTTKEQEMQEYASQLADLKQNSSSAQLRSILLDPAINILFQRMKKDLEETKDKLEQAQNEMSAWKFTADSQTGKKLMSKCRQLILENQELGKQLSQGRIAELEAELALQKKYSEELKSSQDELNDFVIQLDEEVEGMQSTIHTLQQQLKEAKQQIAQMKATQDASCANGLSNDANTNTPTSLSEPNEQRTSVNVNNGAKNWYDNNETSTDDVYHRQSSNSTLNHTGTSENDDDVEEAMDTSSQESEERTQMNRTKEEVTTYPDDKEVKRTTANVCNEQQEQTKDLSTLHNEKSSGQTEHEGSEAPPLDDSATYNKHNNKGSPNYLSDTDSPTELETKDLPYEVTLSPKKTGEVTDAIEGVEHNGLSDPSKTSCTTEESD